MLQFGLTFAQVTCQRLMETVLHSLRCKTLLLCLEDIVIPQNFQTHLEHVEEVSTRLATAVLELKPAKCKLLQTEVKYFSHVVSDAGIATDLDKIIVIQNWPIPQNVRDSRTFRY